VPPEINRQRAVHVLGKIDEILSWKKAKEQEEDTRFVELGECLCEVRSNQYWRLEKLKSFDEFLERRFPGSRRKAYYLMAIHENLMRVPKQQLAGPGSVNAAISMCTEFLVGTSPQPMSTRLLPSHSVALLLPANES
jgi:hypothetical protein